MLKDDLIKKITLRLQDYIDESKLQTVLYLELNNYDIVVASKNEIVEYTQSEDEKATKMFFISKKVEGLSDKSLKYYKNVLEKFASVIVKPLKEITSTDIRFYLAYRINESDISKCTQDNERRVISTFFAWLTAEEYIVKNPVLSVKKVKQEKRIKKPFSEEELELIRKICKNSKERAIIEFLYSTGCRVEELTRVTMKDIDLEQGKVMLFGKGSKERIAFINAKCKLTLKEYLKDRGNETCPLFYNKRANKPYEISYIEQIVRNIGQRAGIEKCHPHKFRRTTATVALNRGMPIDQVKEMLGHENIATTTIYAITDKDNLQAAHKKYVV